jgi:FtsH-binding integral membrane protein
MKASSLCFQAAVLFVLVGMAWGIQMAVSHNHAAFPAHAHLNLLGWVSLFLFGIFYHLHPSIDQSRTARVQVWVWIAGTAVLAVGVGLVHTGTESAEPIAAIGSLTVFASMLAFAWLVLRRERYSATMQAAAVSPAR